MTKNTCSTTFKLPESDGKFYIGNKQFDICKMEADIDDLKYRFEQLEKFATESLGLIDKRIDHIVAHIDSYLAKTLRLLEDQGNRIRKLEDKDFNRLRLFDRILEDIANISDRVEELEEKNDKS